jgi:hypothetical protein
MQTVTVFLASSLELKEDRQRFEQMINRQNKIWQSNGIFLNLFICEDGFDALSQTRSQEEYNKEIRKSDIFVLLFYNKMGKFSEEEFDAAVEQFRATGKPKIFTYFKNIPGPIGSHNRQALQSLWDFQDKLREMQHFTGEYQNIDALVLDFKHQLEQLVSRGVIQLNSTSSGDLTASFYSPILDTLIQNHKGAISTYYILAGIVVITGILIIIFFNFFLGKNSTDTAKILVTIGGLFISSIAIRPYSQIRLKKVKLNFCERVRPNIDTMNNEELKKIGEYILPELDELRRKY